MVNGNIRVCKWMYEDANAISAGRKWIAGSGKWTSGSDRWVTEMVIGC